MINKTFLFLMSSFSHFSTFFCSNEWSCLNSLWCLFFSKFLLKPLKGLIILTNPTVIRGENFKLDIRVCCLLSNISLRMFYLGWVSSLGMLHLRLLASRKKVVITSVQNTWDTLQNWQLSSANIHEPLRLLVLCCQRKSQFAKRKWNWYLEHDWVTWMDWDFNFASHFWLTWLKFVTVSSVLLLLFQD